MKRRLSVTRRDAVPTRRHTRVPLAVGTTVAFVLSSAAPVAALDSDSVQGTVTISVPSTPEACIEIFISGLSFGEAGGLPPQFTSPTGANNVLQSNAPAGTTITNCSTAASTFTARVTDATGSTALWEPYDPFTETGGPAANICDHGTNKFRLSASVTDTEPPSGTFLLTTDRALNGADATDPVLAGTTRTVKEAFTMPCEGSSGVDGEAVIFTMFYTAALAP